MSWRRGAYLASAVAAGALLDELAYWVITHHGIDRSIRLLDRARSAFHI